MQKYVGGGDLSPTGRGRQTGRTGWEDRAGVRKPWTAWWTRWDSRTAVAVEPGFAANAGGKGAIDPLQSVDGASDA